MMRSLLVMSLVLLVSEVAAAEDKEPVAVGGVCNVAADCASKLRCLRNVCVDEDTFDARRPPPSTDSDLLPYAGFVLGSALPATLESVGEGFQLALRVGLLLRTSQVRADMSPTLQFQLEIAPASTVLLNVSQLTYGLADATASAGLLVPLGPNASWIFRIAGGGGSLFASGISPAAFGEIRLDLAGVAIQTSKHLSFELNAPSVRVMIFASPNANTFGNSFMTMWVTNVAVHYLF